MGFKKENLPSNKYKKELCTNEKIRKFEEGTSYVSDYEFCEQTINDFFTELSRNHHVFKTNCKENGLKCCRDVNYYLDYATGIFKSSQLEDHDKKKLIKHVEEVWEPTLRSKDIYICERQTYLDSTRKRCILHHLHDLKEDEDFILPYAEDYNKYLKEKWKKIISYTDSEPSSLYVKIENNSMGIIENYQNFLDSSDYICDNNLDELSRDDIKISTDVNSFLTSISLDRISPNLGKNICYNKPYVDMLKYKASNLQRINNALSIGVAVLGVLLIFIFLYEFGPFGSLLRRCTKKTIEVDENANDEMQELNDNFQNGIPYINYHSVSH
ncbi:PIR protein [Plasmodium ovale]|uniref:PIR protein n=1 Tax=Plasmodium ovale TaxID=36330 RepID=A0A1C3KKI4_PLAOA|nr:PIR protein [Plasmodium ovale]